MTWLLPQSWWGNRDIKCLLSGSSFIKYEERHSFDKTGHYFQLGSRQANPEMCEFRVNQDKPLLSRVLMGLWKSCTLYGFMRN